MSVEFGLNLTKISCGWDTFKNYFLIKNKVKLLQYNEEPHLYNIFFFDDSLVYITIIWKSAVPDGVINSGYSQATNDADKADFENNYKSTSNKSLLKIDEDGRPIVVDTPRVGSELILITHNFCDPTTWYADSVRVTDGYLTDSGDGYKWTSNHINWINLVSGKLFDEDDIASEQEHQYNVEIRVNGILKTARDPFASEGGDYWINYNDGYIIFSSNQSGATVTASYSYATTSTWKLIPANGKYIDIETAEAQFSQDITMNDSIVFEIWVYNPYDLPNKFLYAKTEYKKFSNFIDEALGSYPVIPAIGGSVRGTPSAIYGFPFRYGTVRSVKSSQGVELRVRLKNDQVFNGTHATATFYCTVHDE